MGATISPYWLLGGLLLTLPSLFFKSVRSFLGEQLTAILKGEFIKFVNKNFPLSPKKTAEQIEKNVKDAYKIAVTNAENARRASDKAFSKLVDFKKKSKNDKNYQKKLFFLTSDYEKRLQIAELTRNLVLQDFETRDKVHNLVKKMLDLHENNQEALKEDDIKTLVSVSEQPAAYNQQVLKIMSEQEFSNTCKQELISELEVQSDISTKINVAKAKNKDPKEYDQKLKEINTKIENINSKILEADTTVSQSVETLTNLITLQSTEINYDKLFDSDTETDIESPRIINPEESMSLKTVLDSFSVAAQINSHVKEHLDTVREYARKSESILELGISAYTLGMLWTCVLGMAETSRKTTPVYKGLFSIGQEKDFEAAETQGKDAGVDVDIIGDNPKIEIETSLESLGGNFDTLVINSWFTYCHVKYNLDKFSQITNKYIIICGTTMFKKQDHMLYAGKENKNFKKGDFSEFPPEYDRSKKGLGLAISEFLEAHPEWSVIESSDVKYGITILGKGNNMGVFSLEQGESKV